MRKLITLTLALGFGLGFALAAAAQDDDSTPRRARLLERFDRNGDGNLDQAEREVMRQTLRAELPKLREERRAARRAERPGIRPRQDQGDRPRRAANRSCLRCALIDAFDRNDDGRLGPIERRAAVGCLRRLRDGSGRGQGPGIMGQPRPGREKGTDLRPQRQRQVPGAGRRAGPGQGQGQEPGAAVRPQQRVLRPGFGRQIDPRQPGPEAPRLRRPAKAPVDAPAAEPVEKPATVPAEPKRPFLRRRLLQGGDATPVTPGGADRVRSRQPGQGCLGLGPCGGQRI